MRHAVFFDIDGTLAIQRDVPRSAEEALKALRRNGDLVFLCTGRNPSYVRHHFQSYADGFICANGRYAFMGDTILYDQPIGQALLARALHAAEEAGGGITFFGAVNAYYAGAEDGYAFLERAHHREPLSRFEGMDQMDPIYTFDMFFHSEEERRTIEDSLCDVCILNPHGPHPTADVTTIGNDKGDALQHIAETLGIPKQDTYAFGDGRNDLAMFRTAGHGIAMGNAVAELKEAAEFITGPILEDGVRNGLFHYHLI